MVVGRNWAAIELLVLLYQQTWQIQENRVGSAWHFRGVLAGREASIHPCRILHGSGMSDCDHWAGV